jgi:hypothetical protein
LFAFLLFADAGDADVMEVIAELLFHGGDEFGLSAESSEGGCEGAGCSGRDAELLNDEVGSGGDFRGEFEKFIGPAEAIFFPGGECGDECSAGFCVADGFVEAFESFGEDLVLGVDFCEVGPAPGSGGGGGEDDGGGGCEEADVGGRAFGCAFGGGEVDRWGDSESFFADGSEDGGVVCGLEFGEVCGVVCGGIEAGELDGFGLVVFGEGGCEVSGFVSGAYEENGANGEGLAVLAAGGDECSAGFADKEADCFGAREIRWESDGARDGWQVLGGDEQIGLFVSRCDKESGAGGGCVVAVAGGVILRLGEESEGVCGDEDAVAAGTGVGNEFSDERKFVGGDGECGDGAAAVWPQDAGDEVEWSIFGEAGEVADGEVLDEFGKFVVTGGWYIEGGGINGAAVDDEEESVFIGFSFGDESAEYFGEVG